MDDDASLLTELKRIFDYGLLTGADKTTANSIVQKAGKGKLMSGWQEDARGILDRYKAKKA